MHQTPESMLDEGMSFVTQDQWSLSVNDSIAEALLEARRLALEERNLALSRADHERVAALDEMLKFSLKDEPGTHPCSRLEMVLCWRRRLAALKNRMDKKIASSNVGFRQVVAEARYNLAINSLPEGIIPSVTHAIRSIFEKERKKSVAVFFAISEVVFAHIVDLFRKLDPNEEEGLIQVCLELPEDPTYEEEKTLSRPRNSVAAEDRIRGRYRVIFNSTFAQKLFSVYPSIFNELNRQIKPNLNFVDWSGAAEKIQSLAADSPEMIPPDAFDD